jgi:hypothetical protein
MFKISFTPSHNIKSLFPTYKHREWTKRYRKERQTVTRQEMEPIRDEKKVETNSKNKPISTETQATNPNFHPMKF